MYQERRELLEERDGLRELQKDPATKTADQAKRIHEIDAQLADRREIVRQEEIVRKAEKAALEANVTLYDRIRAAVPSAAVRERALRGVAVDQVGVLKVRPTRLAVDHIVPVREIVEMDGFKDLTWTNQKAIVDTRENLIAMDAAANSSKSDVSWRYWRNASSFYDQATIEAMKLREANVRQLIADAIEKAKKTGVAPP
jgi:hypothetical protein